MTRTHGLVALLLLLLLLATVATAQEPFEVHDREVFMGRTAIWTGVYDFYLDPKDAQVRVRKLMASEIGNPGQIFLRRAGPDNVPHDWALSAPDRQPARLLMGQNIGHIAWQGYEGPEDGWPFERNAQIFGRYWGLGVGSLHLETSGQERVVLEPEGVLAFPGVPTEYQTLIGAGDPREFARIRVRLADGRLGWIRVEVDP